MAALIQISHLLLFILLYYPSLSASFTVIMSDSGAPSALVDGPQSGFSLHNAAVRTDPAEQSAVYDIMSATGNPWATQIPDVCGGRWHGIECMPDNHNLFHVVSLSFGSLSDDTAFPTCDPTRSTISPSLAKLPHLRTLFFYRCFTDNPQIVPSFLGQLGPSLQTLVLRENGLIGPIPTELTNLTRLKVLDLHGNNLNGSIPVGLNRLVGLRSLDLSWNKLTGSIPSLGLDNLRILDLSQNILTGWIPNRILTCRSLIKLDLSRNSLMGVIPESITEFKDLVLLDLSYNQISCPLPTSLQHLSSLEVLILKGNPMGCTMSNDLFDGMLSLMTLILSNMGFRGPIPRSLGRLPNLRVLHLDANYFNGSIPSNFQDLRNLNDLRLNNNMLTGRIPLQKQTIWKMKRKLTLYNNSNLCYDSETGVIDMSASPYSVGIGPCNGPNSEPSRTVQHVSKGKENVTRSDTSLGTRRTSSILVWLFQLTTCIWLIIKLL
ncbi:protein TOO MANY MOUTHS [Cucurbita pepo subsp. pepo]|uniref:protein TOO MANY MOUTHS n=1 Tax=Cucurbita pepo subsp. pepo TaxID=3664 RepID=UPI000C9D2954|nr:protein TOO MANY MOUTHS [Cucurbita pepo subsp. pepo]